MNCFDPTRPQNGEPRHSASEGGWVILEKPSGMTSRSAGGRVARMFGVKKFGHLGTLDPMASGVLPIALGDATKMIPYIERSKSEERRAQVGSKVKIRTSQKNDSYLTPSNSPALCALRSSTSEKEYEFSIRWGIETDTGDITGKVIRQDTSAQCPTPSAQCLVPSAQYPTPSALAAACESLIGEIDQIPPAYSAVHVGGHRAYELARRGEVVDIPPRRVTIYEVRSTKYDLEKAEFIVKCSTGTYVRTLAQQIADRINRTSYFVNRTFICTVDMIRRTRTHNFEIKDAVSLDFLENLYNNAHHAGDESKAGATGVREYLYPVDFGLDDILVTELNENDAKSFMNGGFIQLPNGNDKDMRRVYSEGKFIGIGKIENGLLKPKRVI